MANEFAKVAKRSIADIMNIDEPKVIERGRVATGPVYPNKVKNMILGFVCGAFLSIIIILILFIARDRIMTADDIQYRLGGNVLASIPKEQGLKSSNKIDEKRGNRQ